MIYHVNGILEYCEPGFCVIDCAGVGYRLQVSDNTYTAVAKHIGERQKLLTYLQVREDGVELYGFKNNEELSAFKLLITVSGVGPKAAMAILSLLTPDRLSMAISSEDTKAIAKASGIGPKTAARVILELKDKFSLDTVFEERFDGANINSPLINDEFAAALEALVSLGYSATEAKSALNKCADKNSDADKLIKEALRYLF